ncbi:MAG: lipoyl synthase, partial [SAR324 cluster bacterium]|nr:lipoyl synthase [SAR324 cluster bacterium]
DSGTATFMLLGQECTRACRFCSVVTLAKPALPDPEEPKKLAASVSQLKLKYAVLTTVDRDDLPDQGAAHIAKCINSLHLAQPNLFIELLMPDFQGENVLIEQMADLPLKVLGHNLECVESLTCKVRDPRASYEQSLKVLRVIKQAKPQMLTKSSLMLGLGETKEEVLEAMADLRSVGVDYLTLGQYLQPTKTKLPVERYVTPEEFKNFQVLGEEMGFAYVASGPLVRSSYKAFEFYMMGVV